MTQIIEAAAIPDSKMARAITEYIRDTETALLFNYSSRVYHFGALAGAHRGLKFDRELLYAGAPGWRLRCASASRPRSGHWAIAEKRTFAGPQSGGQFLPQV
jgi:hypothetical protein